jgi:predicted aldo/keto reductase-like oxidoreductase
MGAGQETIQEEREMEYTGLGRTGLAVSAIGLGTEHLHGQPREIVVSTLRRAVELGVNYFDVIFAMPDYLDHLREGFQGHRDQILLTGHLGSTERDGQYYKTRTAKRCKDCFLDVLRRLDTDYVDVLFLHNFNTANDWDRAARSGYLALAARLRDEGRARFLGISGHYPGMMAQAVETGMVDVVMFPINLFSHAMPGRTDLLDLCLRQDVGVVAMKPFGGGKLLNRRGTIRVPGYQAGGTAFKTRIPDGIAPAQCLSYVLAQRGVSVALPGAKNEAELEEALQSLEAAPADRDFSGLLAEFGRYVEGECTYCNHCLPCPVAIDIGQVTRLLDLAAFGLTADLRRAYEALPVTASACTECGACTKRCPFGVDVVANMQRATRLFEAGVREEVA